MRATADWNVVTLPNDDGCFTMNGVIPMDAIVDTGTKKVMIGREVAEMMGITDEDLEPGDAYITAAGTLEAPRGVTKRPVEILIGRGTKNCTSAYVRVVVSHSTRYSFLIGTELIEMVGGMVDTWNHKFRYRQDWDMGGHRMGSVPLRMTREQPRGYLACHCHGGLVDTPEDVLDVEDLLEEEPEVVGVSMPVSEHPELMEAARIAVEVQREAAAERADNLRVWANGLLEKQLEEGVPGVMCR